MLEDKAFKKIMKFVAENPGASLYKIARGTGINRIKVGRKIKQYKLTEKDGFLKMEKGKRNAKNYTFTFGGLVSYFMVMIEPAGWKNIDKIAENYPDMLLTFEKWHLFIRAGLRNQIVYYLQTAFKSAHAYIASHVFFNIPTELGDKKLKLGLDTSILFIPLFIETEEREALMHLYKKDKELREFINRNFVLYEGHYKKIQNAKMLWDNQ